MAISEAIADKLANDEQLNAALTHEQQQENVSPLTDQPVLTEQERHPNHDEILRQVEYYFSDENLPGDAHLLSRTGPTGDGWVSINEILGFKKMRAHKQKSLVKKSLAMSQFVELSDSLKFIRRRTPLTVKPRVQPQVSEKRERDRKLVEQPWLTKAMLKPTGLEENATDGPITPEQYQEEQKLFDPDEAFNIRIERAVNRFVLKRKMHQGSAKIFTKFLLFGGFEANSNAFGGRRTKKELEEYDAEELAEIQARYSLADRVYDGTNGVADDETKWEVDFENMCKAFLSSELFQSFDWRDEKIVVEATSILRKFYRYLLIHDVCNEYEDEINKAIDICILAEKELPKLAQLDVDLPGLFNKACSTLFGGKYARDRPQDPKADWVLASDVDDYLSDKDARAVFSAGIAAYGTDEQLKKLSAQAASTTPSTATPGNVPAAKSAGIEKHLSANSAPAELSTGTPANFPAAESVGIEIVKVELAPDAVRQFYDRLRGTIVKPAGKLHCIGWKVPHARPSDLPSAVLKTGNKDRAYEFVVEEDILKNCMPGMKFEVMVKQLNGFQWIDAVELVYPSFYKWTLNEEVRDWKHPGPPTKWMARQILKAKGYQIEEGGDVDGMEGDDEGGELEGGAEDKEKGDE